MSGDLFLGLDVGSSSTKAVLVDADGAVVADARLEHGISRPRPGWAEQDAERDWWGGVVEACRRVLDGRAARVRGRGRERARPLRAPGRRGRTPTPARDPLRHRLARERAGRTADGRARRRRDPCPLRLTAVEPVGGTQDPLARGGGAGGVVRDAAHLRRDAPSSSPASPGSTSSIITAPATGRPSMTCTATRGSMSGRTVWRRELLLPRLVWPQEECGRVSREAAAATGLPRGHPGGRRQRRLLV